MLGDLPTGPGGCAALSGRRNGLARIFSPACGLPRAAKKSGRAVLRVRSGPVGCGPLPLRLPPRSLPRPAPLREVEPILLRLLPSSCHGDRCPFKNTTIEQDVGLRVRAERSPRSERSPNQVRQSLRSAGPSSPGDASRGRLVQSGSRFALPDRTLTLRKAAANRHHFTLRAPTRPFQSLPVVPASRCVVRQTVATGRPR